MNSATKFGLSAQELQFLKKHLILPFKREGFKVYIFGSRALGKNHPYSDVDILLSGKVTEDSNRLLVLTREFFEESRFPYKVDIVLEQNLAESYRASIFDGRIEFSDENP